MPMEARTGNNIQKKRGRAPQIQKKMGVLGSTGLASKAIWTSPERRALKEKKSARHQRTLAPAYTKYSHHRLAISATTHDDPACPPDCLRLRLCRHRPKIRGQHHCESKYCFRNWISRWILHQIYHVNEATFGAAPINMNTGDAPGDSEFLPLSCPSFALTPFRSVLRPPQCGYRHGVCEPVSLQRARLR